MLTSPLKEALHGKPFFSRRLERMAFPKKLCWNMIFPVLLGTMIFPFPKNMILHLRWSMIFLKRYTEIRYFLQTFWKVSPKKGCAGPWSFLYYLEKCFFFFCRKHDIFSLGRKWNTVFLRKYMETWCIFLLRRTTGNLIYRIEVWLLLKFIRLEIFCNE